MTTAELTAIAGVIAVIIAGIGMATAAIYRIGKLSEATARIPQEMKVELQRIHDRIGQHETLNGEQFLRNQDLIRHNGELIRRVEKLVRMEAERTREQIRNLHQSIMSHSHDEDGAVMFRVPPPEPDQ